MYASCGGMALTMAWQRPVVAFDPYHAAIEAPDVIRPDGKPIGRAGYAVKRKNRSARKPTSYFNRLRRHGICDLKAVVSGLPLLSMGEGVQRAILGAAFRNLRPGGRFIQFTYGAAPPVCRAVLEELSLGWTRSGKIWSNVPPATSYVFHRKHEA